MLNQLVKAAMILLMTIAPTMSTATTQINNSNISQSNIISGNNNSIINYNNTTKVYPLSAIKIDTRKFERQTEFITNANAERAIRNKRYQLAAEIWQEVYDDAVAAKKSKKAELVSLLENRSFAEAHFNKTKAYLTLKEAINLDKNNITLHEKSANLAIDNYQLTLAKLHLVALLDNFQIRRSPQNHTALRYQANQRLHAISALEYRVNETIKYAIEASNIFNKEFNPKQQIEFRTDQAVMLQVALQAGLELTTFPPEIITVYKTSFAIINPNRTPTFLGTDKKGVWLSIHEGKSVRLNNDSSLEKFDVFETLEDTPRYIIGESLEKILSALYSATTWRPEFDNYNEKDVLRHFLTLQERLSSIALQCNECPISPISSMLGYTVLGGAFESSQNPEFSHFYYSLAIKKIHQSDQAYKANPNYKTALIKLYEKLGLARKELTATHGFYVNNTVITGPFLLAAKVADELAIEQSNNAKILAQYLQILNLYGSALSSTFDSKEAEIQCSKSHDLFKRISQNAYITDEDVIKSYIGCTQTLLIGYHVFKEDEKYKKTLETFIQATKNAGIEVDLSVFQFIKSKD